MTTTTSHVQPDLPDDVTEDGAALLDEVYAALSKYVILPSDHAMTGVVLWIAATHAVPAWTHATRLVIWAPEKACGKSRLMQLIRALCHRELMAVNVSSSAVYRAISQFEADPPTILLDEADTIFGAKAAGDEDLRGLLNGGFERDAYTLRYDAGTREVEKLSTFAMAALAGIGRHARHHRGPRRRHLDASPQARRAGLALPQATRPAPPLRPPPGTGEPVDPREPANAGAGRARHADRGPPRRPLGAPDRRS